ncbi:MAG: hypothetical protein AEth_01323 [Candidatus Argoarchaeum ethanivorans]|uniref:Uncharacterized protein n=1 Tax=Candidatus Argoarchaeum ethanivorans TaxID=2608793 RepID=A0A8B3S1K0_9EURY|nr:MAG: hypothetical protein AEth_01323 [Candidatus Argoarchaeum ethanivorans]
MQVHKTNAHQFIDGGESLHESIIINMEAWADAWSEVFCVVS